MNRSVSAFLASGVIASLSLMGLTPLHAATTKKVGSVSTSSVGKTKLLWAEEFTGKAGGEPNSKYWNFDLGDGSAQSIPGWGNNEREFYTKESTVLDGTKTGGLTISTTKPVGETPPLCYYGVCEWVSGKIHTANKVSFKYGLVEARIKMPEGGGTWPAMWMLGTSLLKSTSWPDCGEIDIIEAQGNNPSSVIGSAHGPGYSSGSARTFTSFSKAELSKDYHTYGINWAPGKISWLFDGKVYYTLKKADVAPDNWPFDNEFYLILNLAMGGNLGGDIDPSIEKADLKVDWIRYSSVNGLGKVTLR